MPAGAQAALLIGAGNHDPRPYEDPETFDPKRNPVDHLSSGGIGARYPQSVTDRTLRAGDPSTTVPARTSLVTTEAAATTALSPMLTPGRMVTFEPIQTLRPMMIGAGCMSPRWSGEMSWLRVASTVL